MALKLSDVTGFPHPVSPGGVWKQFCYQSSQQGKAGKHLPMSVIILV